MKQKTWVEVSKKALQINIAELKTIIGEDVFILAIIKGNAYGAGIETTVSATKSIVAWFGVDSLDEANLARKNCQNPILILGYVANNDAADVVKNQFSVIVYNYDLAVALSRKATAENPAKIHIKVDTGLVRLGLWPEDAIILVKKISKLPNIIVEGMCTHFAKLINENNVEIYSAQLKKFIFVVDSLANLGIQPKIMHAASSMSAVLYKATHLNMVRIGSALYGLWGRESLLKFMHEKNNEFNLCPALSWKTTVVNIKKIPLNTGVGYLHSEIVSRDTTVAVLGAGCYDGIDKRYAKVGYVLINGKRAKILGGITMNMCMVDATGIENIKIGDEAVLIG